LQVVALRRARERSARGGVLSGPLRGHLGGRQRRRPAGSTDAGRGDGDENERRDGERRQSDELPHLLLLDLPRCLATTHVARAPGPGPEKTMRLARPPGGTSRRLAASSPPRRRMSVLLLRRAPG